MRRCLVPAVLALVLLAGGCTSFAHDPPSAARVGQVVTSAPDRTPTVIGDGDAAAAAVSASRALFDRAPVVVVVRAGDRAATLLGASAAVGLGVPLLVDPGGGSGALADELDRLGAATVLAVGAPAATPAPGGGKRTVLAVPAEPRALAEATGLDLASGDPVPQDGDAAAVVALDPARPTALVPQGTAPGDDRAEGRVPTVTRAEPLTGTVVLATGGPETVAGLATARAAGARVALTGGPADPRASQAAVAALGEQKPGAVVLLGSGFAAEDGLDWKLAAAETGVQLPGGGQTLFPGRMLVALYGHPGTAGLGVLGEQGIEASIDRARAHAAAYQHLVGVPVVPAFEIIATVASSAAGPDGNYSSESDPATLRPWVEAAGRAGLYVVLDLQPGRADFRSQAEQYRSLLELPWVGLALDPEWRLGPGEAPLHQIGTVGIDEVNGVVTWLADLTRQKQLPQKLFVLHQFKLAMVQGRERLDTSRAELAVTIHADGQGSQGQKQDTWRVLHQNAPDVHWGWKNFYDEDHPMLTPEQTIAQVNPRPDLVSYQ
jgi:hypothetical protein